MNRLLFFMISFLIFDNMAAQDINMRQEMKWELGYGSTYEVLPEQWIPSKVPGAVQLDIASAEKYQPYFYAGHWKDYLWMEDNYYTYRSKF